MCSVKLVVSNNTPTTYSSVILESTRQHNIDFYYCAQIDFHWESISIFVGGENQKASCLAFW